VIFQDSMQMGMEITVFRSMTPDSLVVGYQAFSGNRLLRLQGRSVLMSMLSQNSTRRHIPEHRNLKYWVIQAHSSVQKL
jgi:hypothetical protein